MKITKSHLTVIITVAFGIILLALQQPITKSLMDKSGRLDAKFAKIYTIKNTFELPESLNEISGISWLSDNTFACIQDEDGIIFIYDTEQQKITKQIEFANSGDYEGIAIHKDNAFVMQSDGVLYKVKNYLSDTLQVTELETSFSKKNNIESLTLDADNNRLLIAPKDEGLMADHLKSIYQIPLHTMQMEETPLFKIDLKAKALKDFRHKKIENTFNPSDIAIHPKTKDIYVLEGKKPKLMILDSKGKILTVHELDQRKFTQPEGITFSEDGRLFISNETDGNSAANILEVKLNNDK
jgi:uncharacterized protein YjiK